MPQHGRHQPRRGSMQFWPRVRSKRIYPRIKNWPEIEETIPVAFAGYKVGMTHFLINDNTFTPVTILEVPPIKVLGFRLYRYDINKGYQSMYEVLSNNIDERVKRKIKTIVNNEDIIEDLKKADSLIEKTKLVKLIVHTQPWLTTVKKKKSEVFEIPIGGKDIKKAYEYAKNMINKELKLTDIFKEGEYIDVISITKGHGFTGEVKRFGVTIQPREHKVGDSARHVQSRGARGMHRIFPTTPMPGQYGFFRRTEYNKLILKISDNPEEINPKSGWPHYGVIKNTWIAIKGSIGGSIKRLIILRKAIRPHKKEEKVKIEYISLAPKN